MIGRPLDRLREAERQATRRNRRRRRRERLREARKRLMDRVAQLGGVFAGGMLGPWKYLIIVALIVAIAVVAWRLG